MNRPHAAALAALVLGLALLAYGSARGDVRAGLFLIVPFVYGTGLLPALGTLLLMAAALLWFFGHTPRSTTRAPDVEHPAHATHDERATRETRHGGIVLLGPIPIVWGSDKRILPWMIALGAAMLLLAALVFWIAR